MDSQKNMIIKITPIITIFQLYQRVQIKKCEPTTYNLIEHKYCPDSLYIIKTARNRGYGISKLI